jgi:exodeoxyribonuclease VII large subunit
MEGNANRLTLLELSEAIQQTLNNAFSKNVWVVCEISELNINRNGHCYLDLVDKDENSATLKARVRATIWASTFRMLRPFFESSTNRKLTAGLKVLLYCSVSYHPLYGLALNVTDIDPSYTLGELENQRRATIEKLINEGVFEMNKELIIPIPPKRVAIISSGTAAGFQDFTNQIDNNPAGYKVEYKLFDAVVQGDQAESSIVAAINQIYFEVDRWDIVAIIRGGGSQTDLSCFDNYTVATNIAQFPIPVITGIGHEKDVLVADLVANTRLKTPTAAAEFILEKFDEASYFLTEAVNGFTQEAKNLLNIEKLHIMQQQSQLFPSIIQTLLEEKNWLSGATQKAEELIVRRIISEKNLLSLTTQRIWSNTQNQIEKAKHFLLTTSNKTREVALSQINKHRVNIEKKEIRIESINPENVLKRGYSITLKNGKLLTSVSEVNKGDKIKTILMEGNIWSEVDSIEK